MLVIKPLLLCLIVYMASVILGRGLFPELRNKGICMPLVGGLLTLWTLFYVVCIVCIFIQTNQHGMDHVMIAYSAGVIALLLVSVVLLIIRVVKKQETIFRSREEIFGKKLLDKKEMVYLGLFLGLVLYQLYKAIFFAYADGDDAYYVAVSQSVSGNVDALYKYNAYTGLEEAIAYRYALAPFPIWQTYFSRLLGLNAATIAHICMPLLLIPVTYFIYNAIGIKLYKDNRTKRYMFLCLISVFVLFSRYSMYSPEFFMLARTRQGKEALGNIIIPILFFVMADIVSREKWNIKFQDVLLLFVVCISAALTSVFGNLVVLLVLFGIFVYSFVKKTGWKDRILPVVPGIINLAVMAMYIIK